MPRMFTVRWPYFARLEAMLLFPPAVMVAAKTGVIAPFLNENMVQTFITLSVQAGLSKQAGLWADIGVVLLVPWLLALLLIDRFLTVRKGYAFLSLAAIGAWTEAAQTLSDRIAPCIPDSIAHEITWLPFDQQVAVAAAGLALFVHLKPLLTGLLDQGGVATRLLSSQDESDYSDADTSERYRRERPDMRIWHPPATTVIRKLQPRENPAAKFLYAMTWIGIISSGGVVWYVWNGQHPAQTTAALPATAPVITSAAHAVTAAVPAVDARVVAPADQAKPVAVANVYTAPIPAVPAVPGVRRPSDLPNIVQPSNTHPGRDEASATRSRDGHYRFDAEVNGVHIPMLFDTGATIVALRAEDVLRMGINLSDLKFTERMRTANGTSLAAPFTIESLTIGDITQRNVTGVVVQSGKLTENLLGQSFMGRLAGYDVEDNQLVLKSR